MGDWEAAAYEYCGTIEDTFYLKHEHAHSVAVKLIFFYVGMEGGRRGLEVGSGAEEWLAGMLRWIKDNA